MSKQNSLIIMAVAAIAVVIMSGGSFWLMDQLIPRLIRGRSNVTKLETDQLTLLGDTFSGYSTFRSAEFQDALKEVGLSLNYLDEFNQKKRAELLNQGKADLLVTTLDQFLKHKTQGKIVGLIDRTVGADAVVLNTKEYPNLKSLLDLSQLVQKQHSQGKQLSITYAGDTPSEYLALVLSTKFEAFNLSDFQVKEVADASEAWNLLKKPKQNVAVAVIWEPYVTQAKQEGYTVVLSSQDAPKAIIDVIVASDRLINSQPQKISALLEAYYRRIDANRLEPSQLKKQIAEDGKLSPHEAAAVMQGIDFFTSIEAKNWINDGILEKRIDSIAAVLLLTGRINRVSDNPKQLFTSQFITKAASNTETLITRVNAEHPELADRLTRKGKTVAANLQVTNSQIKTAVDIGNLQVSEEVKFEFGSAQLTKEGQQTINQLAEEIREFNEQTVAVRVIGHTSKTGSADSNQKLSQKRAQVVVDALRARGLKHNFVAEGKGFYLPLSGIPREDPRQQRTEIRLVRKE